VNGWTPFFAIALALLGLVALSILAVPTMLALLGVGL